MNATFWEKDEPREDGSCAMMEQFKVDGTVNYLWVSENCAAKHRFICEAGSKRGSWPPGTISHEIPPSPEHIHNTVALHAVVQP